MAFGEPESMSRDGDIYTALGKRKAQTDVRTGKGPVRVFSEKKVTFTMTLQAGVLYVKDITGVKVQHLWLPFISPRTLEQARIRMSGSNFQIDAVAGGFPVRLTVDQKGNVS